MTTRTNREAVMTVSESLRALAAFLDDHQEIKVGEQNVTILHYVSTRKEIAECARAASWRKVYTNDYFELHRDFGNGITIQVYTPRGQVCEKVVVGKRIVPARPAEPEREEEVVEWVCRDEPLLVTQ